MGLAMKGIRGLKNSASFKSRMALGKLSSVFGTPPQIIDAPNLAGGFYESPDTDPLNRFLTAPTLILTAAIGAFDNTDGATVVTSDFYVYESGAWVAQSATPVTLTGDLAGLSFTVPSEILGKNIQTRTQATRGGITSTYISDYAAVEALPSTPRTLEFRSVEGAPFVGVNQPCTKTAYLWTDGAVVTPVVIAGEWYKNEIATGVTGALFPDPDAVNPAGRTTAEGDLVRWQETCTNAIDVTGVSGSGLNSNGAYRHVQIISDIMINMRTNIRSEISSRIAGKSGGTANCYVHSPATHSAGTYVANTDLWANDLRYQLTAHPVCIRFGAPAYNKFTARYGNFLITPRHVLTAMHVGPTTDQRYLRFVNHLGSLVEARTTTNATIYDGFGTPDEIYGASDHQIILLDKDMSAEGCHVLPILTFPEQYVVPFFTPDPGNYIPLVGLSMDGYGNALRMESSGNTAWGWPLFHSRILFIKCPQNTRQDAITRPPEYDGYHYEPYQGDSGGASMVLAYGKFFVVCQHFGGNMITTTTVAPWAKQGIIDLIARCDAKAVAQGFLTEPTGLLPDFVDYDDVQAYPVPTPPV